MCWRDDSRIDSNRSAALVLSLLSLEPVAPPRIPVSPNPARTATFAASTQSHPASVNIGPAHAANQVSECAEVTIRRRYTDMSDMGQGSAPDPETGGGGSVWLRKAPGSPACPSIAAIAMLNISRAAT